jgi:hypothetical protein
MGEGFFDAALAHPTAQRARVFGNHGQVEFEVIPELPKFDDSAVSGNADCAHVGEIGEMTRVGSVEVRN